MAYQAPAFYDVAAQFLEINDALIDDLGILAIIAGGSLFYQHAIQGTVSEARDFDGALIVQTTADVAALFGKKRAKLRQLLAVDREECEDLQVPGVGSEDWNNIDGVRYSGVSSTGLKKSIKILTAVHFFGDDRTMNVLSYKDRRVYEGVTLSGRPAVRVQPATRLGTGLTILHDPWLFKGCNTNDQEVRDVSFGVTADLILTGVWIHGEELGRSIRERLLRYARSVVPGLRTYHFTRSARFQSEYRNLLSAKLGVDIGMLGSLRGHGDNTMPPALLFGDVDLDRKPMLDQRPGTVSSFPNETIFCTGKGGLLKFDASKVMHSPFTNNAENSIVSIQAKGNNRRPVKLIAFCKRALVSQQLSECQGALQAARYFPLVQQPLVESGWLLYPYVPGLTESEVQLDFFRGCPNLWQSILDVEMRKAEDKLNAYKWSLHPAPADGNPSKEWQIHRFFYQRLLKEFRFREFYKHGIQVNDQRMDLETLLDMPLNVDGVAFPSLRKLHARATQVLRPSRFKRTPVAFGLGDAHGGNIMIENRIQSNSARRLLYVDYEVSAHHSPILDLAKPLYNDVFFGALYSDCILDASRVEVLIKRGRLLLRLHNTDRKLSQGILEIKRRYLIEPLLLHAPGIGMNSKAGVEVLSSCLFASALLTRNFSEYPQAFFVNLCHAVKLSQVKTLPGLWATCSELLEA